MNMPFNIDYKINAGTLLQMVIVLTAVISAFFYLKSDVDKVKQELSRQQEFRADVRANYITREQLEYIVIDRFDRFEENIGEQLLRLEQSIKEQNQRNSSD